MKRVFLLLEVLMIIFSLYTGILLVSYEEEEALLLFLAPLLFAILKITFIKYINLSKSIVSFMVISFSFIRGVVTPFFIYMSNYELFKFGYSFYMERLGMLRITDYNQAILLFCYEMIVAYLFLFFLNINFYKIKQKKYTKESLKVKYFIYFSILFLVVLFLIYPEIIKKFQFIYEIGKPEYVLKVKSLKKGGEGIPGFLVTFLSLLFVLIQILLPAYFMKKKKSMTINFLCLVLLIFIFSEEKMGSIIAAIILLCNIYSFYPKYRTSIKVLMLLSLITGGTLLFFKSKSTLANRSLYSNISLIFSVYFGGITNIAYSMKMPSTSSKVIFIDILRSIPFVGSFFFKDNLNSTTIFNYTIYRNDIYADQILPMIGQGYFYFGFLLAPFLTVIVLLISFYSELKLKKEKNIIFKSIYYFMVIYFSYSIFCWNMSIFTVYLFRTLILLIICKNIKFYNKN